MTTMTETLWLRGQTAQRDLQHLASYGAAFIGTASVQALHLSLTGPRSFWTAMARVAAQSGDIAPAKATAPISEVVALMPAADPAPVANTEPPVAPEPQAIAERAAATPAPASPAPVLVSDEPDAEPEATSSPHLLDAPRGGVPDDLTALSGVGAKLAAALNEFGIYHYDQIASLDEAGIAWLDAQQKGFRMICGRYDLVGQAKARG